MTRISPLPSSRRLPGTPHGERGSAYLFVLLALLVLTVIGLSVAVITQTEVQIGAAEKTVTRVLYGGDAGARVQLAQKMVRNSGEKTRYNFLPDVVVAGASFSEDVDTAPILVAYHGDCNLCTMNEDSENRMAIVNFVTNAQGRRIGVAGGVDVPQANKLISIMYLVQPHPTPIADFGLKEFDSALTVDDATREGLDVIVY